MKKLLTGLLLALVTLGTAAAQQTVITVPLPESLADKAWVKTYVDSIRKADGKAPAPQLAACKRGPTIKEVLEVANTAIQIQFDGEDVFQMEYEVYLAGAGLVKKDSVKPKTSIITLPYPPLPNGVYRLLIRGKSCKSASDSETQFIIKSDQGNDIPVPTPGSPATDGTVAKKVSSGLKENMNIYFVTLPDGTRLFSDSSEVLPVNGQYEFQYGVNNHVIRQSVPLRNYRWPSNTPLQVWKAQAKKGIENLYKWGNDGGWWDPAGCIQFARNDAFPFATFYFQKPDSAHNVRIQTAHWMDFMPDMQLPTGQVWVMPIGIDSPDLLMRKGVTHFSKYQTAGKPYEARLQGEGRIYDEVPQTPAQFGLPDYGPSKSNWIPKVFNEEKQLYEPLPWPLCWNERFFGPLRPGQTEPLTYEQGREAGARYSTFSPIVIFENSEQDHAIGAQWPFVRGFYEVFRERMDAEWLPKGIEPLIAHNYFTKIDGEGLTLGTGGKQANKDAFKPGAAWPASQLLPGGTLHRTSVMCQAYYLKSPDLTRDEAYKFIFSAGIAALIDKALLLFPQAMHEHFPNNYRAVYYPDGTFFLRTKQEYNPAEVITMSFVAQCFGKGVVPFSASPKNSQQFRFSREWHYTEGNLWLPRGANDYSPIDQFPYWSEQEEFPGGIFEYNLAEGVRLYCATLAKVKGGEKKFLEYRIDSGPWVKPVNHNLSDLVDAYYAKTGIVYSQSRNGLLGVFYLNPYADTDLHRLEYKYNGKVYAMQVHSTIVHPVLHQL